MLLVREGLGTRLLLHCPYWFLELLVVFTLSTVFLRPCFDPVALVLWTKMIEPSRVSSTLLFA